MLVQPLRTATECEFDLARNGPDRAIRLRPWMPKQLKEHTRCKIEPGPLTRNSPCELHALAYNLANFLRTLATPEPIKDWSLTSLKDKLIKIGAKVVSHGRYVAFQMAEIAIPRNLFTDILRMIAELRPPPVASTA